MKLKLLLLLVVLGVLSVFFFGRVRDHRIQSGFTRIQPDATEQSVRELLGRPSSVDHSCSAYGTQLSENCDHVLIYKSSFAPLKPSYWLVFFDAAGHTKATSRQAQP